MHWPCKCSSTWQQRFIKFISNICAYHTIHTNLLALCSSMHAGSTDTPRPLSVSFLSFPFNLLSLIEHAFKEQCEKLKQVYLQWGCISQRNQRRKDQWGQQPELSQAHPSAWSHICCSCRLLLCGSAFMHFAPSSCFSLLLCHPVKVTETKKLRRTAQSSFRMVNGCRELVWIKGQLDHINPCALKSARFLAHNVWYSYWYPKHDGWGLPLFPALSATFNYKYFYKYSFSIYKHIPCSLHCDPSSTQTTLPDMRHMTKSALFSR